MAFISIEALAFMFAIIVMVAVPILLFVVLAPSPDTATIINMSAAIIEASSDTTTNPIIET